MAASDRQRAPRQVSGQVLLEYLLMVIVCLSVVLIIKSSLQGSIFHFWTQLAKEIAAACPRQCNPPQNIR